MIDKSYLDYFRSVRVHIAYCICLDQVGESWQQAYVGFSAVHNFQVAIEANTYDGFQGDLAIDDVTFSPDCQPDTSGKLRPEPRDCDPDSEFR